MAKKISTTNAVHYYDWDQWLDGDIWELTRGEDFTCAVESMRQQAHAAASRRGMHARTHCKDDQILMVQGLPLTTKVFPGPVPGSRKHWAEQS